MDLFRVGDRVRYKTKYDDDFSPKYGDEFIITCERYASTIGWQIIGFVSIYPLIGEFPAQKEFNLSQEYLELIRSGKHAYWNCFDFELVESGFDIQAKEILDESV